MSASVPDTRTIRGAGDFLGELRVPGDKSISQRVALLAGLARGSSEIHGFLRGEDGLSTLGAMVALGARAEWAGDVLRVTGTGGRLRAPDAPIDLGNSGTGMRLLAGVLAGQSFDSTLVGDTSLMSRPMRRIQEPLEKMGARLTLTGDRGTAPIHLRGGSLHRISYPLPVASAQVKSSVLLAGLFADGITEVIEPIPCRDHTELALQACGVDLTIDGGCIRVRGAGTNGPELPACTWMVPGDFSSAAFWLAAAAGRPGRNITVHGVGLNPRRTALLDVLQRMGAQLEVIPDPAASGGVGEPCGTIHIQGAELRGTQIGGTEIPNLIDELPLVAALGALAEGETIIRDAAELRVKESDRIGAMTAALRSLGVETEEREDGMRIQGGLPVDGETVRVQSRGDHRIAMSIAVLALYGQRPVVIDGTACTETSFPGFWEQLVKLGGLLD